MLIKYPKGFHDLSTQHKEKWGVKIYMNCKVVFFEYPFSLPHPKDHMDVEDLKLKQVFYHHLSNK